MQDNQIISILPWCANQSASIPSVVAVAIEVPSISRLIYIYNAQIRPNPVCMAYIQSRARNVKVFPLKCIRAPFHDIFVVVFLLVHVLQQQSRVPILLASQHNSHLHDYFLLLLNQSLCSSNSLRVDPLCVYCRKGLNSQNSWRPHQHECQEYSSRHFLLSLYHLIQ